MAVNNDIQISGVSNQPSISSLPEGQTPVSTSPGVHDAHLKQTLERAGKQLQDILSTMKDQAPSVHFAGPPGKNDALDKGKLRGPDLPPPPANADQKQMEEYQKKMAEYTNMMQTLANVLKMMEDMQRSITANIR